MVDDEKSVGALVQTVRQLGYEVTHAHENLVFASRNRFILKQTDTPHMVDLYFNEELEEQAAEALMVRIESTGLENSLLISYKGAYCITENDDQSFSVEFFDLVTKD